MTVSPELAATLQRLAGRVTTTAPRDSLSVECPLTGAPLADVPKCTGDDVAHAVRRAREAQRGWAAKPISERAKVFLRFHDLVLDARDEILDILQLENGKARKHAFEEVLDAPLTARYYANTAAKHLKPRRRQGAFPLMTQTWEYHHPKGVVGIISPWNYPLALGISDAIPALLAGNGVVTKPDQQTPFAALWAAEKLSEAGLPDDVLHVVTGSGSELGTPLINAVDFMMFTGSTATGRVVAKQAAERLIDYSMELGGKNAMIVLDDADLEWTVPGAIRGAFANTGQLCISMERLYVQSGIYDEFVRRFADAAKSLRLSASLDFSGDVGSLVSRKQFDTVTAHVEDAVSRGARVLAGGKPRPDIGPYFFEPTVLAEVNDTMTCFGEETFGPVIAVAPFDTVDEVIKKANDSPFGLNFSVWTKDRKRGREIATQLEAGTVNVNEAYAAAWASLDAPMGGFKDSGVGRRHGEHGIQKYTESQTVASQRWMPIDAPPGMPFEKYAKMTLRLVRLQKRLPWVK